MEDEKLQEIYLAIDSDETMSDEEKLEAKTLAKIKYEDSLKNSETEEVEGKENDSLPTDADVDQEDVVSETEDMESTSEDGSLDSQEKTINEQAEELIKNDKKRFDDLKLRLENGEEDSFTKEEAEFLNQYEDEDVSIIGNIIPEQQTIEYDNGSKETYNEVINNMNNLQENYVITGKKSSELYNFDENYKPISFKENVTDEQKFDAYVTSQDKNIFDISAGGDQELEEVGITNYYINSNGEKIKWKPGERQEALLLKEVNIPEVENSIQSAIDIAEASLEMPDELLKDNDQKVVDLTKPEEVVNIKNTVFKDFIQNNKRVQEIIQEGKSIINYETQVKEFREKHAKEFPLNTIEEIEANWDKITVNEDGTLAYTEVNNFGNELISSYLFKNNEFFSMLEVVEEKVNERLDTDYEKYQKISNTAQLLRWSFGDDKDKPYGGYNIQRMLDVLGIQYDKGKYTDEIELIKEIENGLANSTRIEIDDNVKGYFLPDFIFTKAQSEEGVEFNLKNRNPYQFYILNDGETLPAGVKEITYKKYKKQVNSIIDNKTNDINKDAVDLAKKENILQYFDTFDLKEFESGKNAGANLATLALEQAPMMLFAIATLGTGPALLQTGETYYDIVQNQAAEAFNLKDGEAATSQQLLSIVEDDQQWNKIKAGLVGTLYGSAEAIGAFVTLGKVLKPGIASILRGQVKFMLKEGIKTGAKLTTAGVAEGLTEFLQELSVQIGGGGEIDTEALYDNAKTGVIAGVTLFGVGSASMQSVTEVRSLSRMISGKLDKKSAEAYLNNAITEYDKIDTSNYGAAEMKTFNEKRQSFIDYKNANKNVPSQLNGKDKDDYVENAVEIYRLERDSKEANELKIKELKTVNEGIKVYNERLEVLQGKSSNLEKLFNDADTGQTLRVAQTTSDNVKINEELNNEGWSINEEDSTNYGNIYTKDGETVVVLNLEQAVLDNKIATTEHEFLHALLKNTLKDQPETQKALSNSMLKYIKGIDEKVVNKDTNFGRRLAQYRQRQAEGKMSEGDMYEETLTLFAEALVEGEIVIPKNRLQEMKSMFTRVVKSIMVKFGGAKEVDLEGKLEFNTIEDFAKFIKSANESIQSGELTSDQKKALSGEADVSGITGNLLQEKLTEDQQNTDKASLKESNKKLTPEIENEVEIDLDIIKELKEESSNEEDITAKNPSLTLLENKVMEAISPTVKAVAENRTKALFDNIPDDLRAGLTREQYRQGLIDDMNLMVLNEFDPSLQSLEEFIVNRGFLRAYSKATRQGVKQQFDYSIDQEGTEFDIPDTADFADPSMEDVIVRKEISPTSLLSEQDQILATQSVADYIAKEKIDINSLDYKSVQKMRTAASLATANFFNVPENKIVIGKNNLNAGESLNARMAINKNADSLLAMLPEGYITKEGAPESLIGTSTGVGNTLLKLFYTKSEKRGKNLTPWVLRKDISRKEFLAAFGIQADGKFNAKADGQRIKALMVLMQGNVTNEILRGLPGLTELGKHNIAKGKSKSMASLKDSKYLSKEDNLLFKQEEMIYKLSNAFGAVTEYENLSAEDARDFMVQYMNNEEALLKNNPTAYGIVREVVDNETQARSEEGRKTKGFTTEVKNLIKTEDFNVEYPGLSDNLTMTLMSDSEFKGNTEKGKAAREQFKNQSLDLANELGTLFNFDKINQGGRGAGSDPVSFMIGLFGGHQGRIGKNGEALVNSDWKNGLKEGLNNGDGRETIFSEGLIADLQSFKFGDLVTTYATDLKNKYNEIRNIKDPVKRREAAAKLFNTKGAKAQVQMYSLFNRALEEWLHVETPGSPAFNKKADYILKLKKGNSAAGLTGERILSPPGYMYLGDADANDRTYVEHLMPSSNMSMKSADLILKNKWANKGVEALGEYQSIYGTLNTFNTIDESTGKVNSSGLFRFAKNLDIAKDIYKIEGGFKISLYDEMKNQIYDVEGRGKVSGEVLIKEIENNGEAIFNNNSALLHDIGRDDLIPDTNIDNPKYANNEELIDNLNIARQEEADNNIIAIANQNSDVEITDVQTAQASIKETNNTFVTDLTSDQIALQQADISSFINEAIELNTGINRNYTYSEAKGRAMGDVASRSFLNTIMPYSAEDFRGLLYVTLAKGKKGDEQMAYYKKNILDPFNAAEGAVTKKQVAIANDFKALKALYPSMPKTLKEKIGIGEYTHSDALRVWTWASQGEEIPGLSKTDQRKLINFVNENNELNNFAKGLQGIQQGSKLQAPGENWLAGNIGMDLMEGIGKGERKKYLNQSGWTANIDALYSKENLSKMRAAYGNSYVEALQDNIRRMKSGSNRPMGGNKVTDNLLDWMNNSVGTVMFLNTRSAVLQTLSSVNFVNWSDNNPLAAGKALLNVPQYSSDFMKLMNSEYLVNRRNGLKINVSESEIADAMAQGGKGPKAIINLLLNKGFVLTQYADSFAIATGGATFFRNRTNSYLKETNPTTGNKYTSEEAEAAAFVDFQNISEESQQSARTDRISMQQASAAGRVVLAFANTPMQYARIQKRAIQDLIDGRGDAKSNISKLAYYGFIQNAAFNSIQNALYTEMFEDDEEEEIGKTGKQKSWDIINGMADSNLRGMGIGGAAASAVKNSILTLADEATKKSPQFRKAISDLFDFSPPLDSKIRKLTSAANTMSWERDQIERQGFDIDNPATLASAQVLSAATNIPLDRALMKLNNLRNAASKRSEAWQKICLMLGVSAWEVGLPYYGVESMQEENDRLREENQKKLILDAKREKARLEKLAAKREARRKLEERIRADERKRIEKENKNKNKK